MSLHGPCDETARGSLGQRTRVRVSSSVERDFRFSRRAWRGIRFREYSLFSSPATAVKKLGSYNCHRKFSSNHQSAIILLVFILPRVLGLGKFHRDLCVGQRSGEFVIECVNKCRPVSCAESAPASVAAALAAPGKCQTGLPGAR